MSKNSALYCLFLTCFAGLAFQDELVSDVDIGNCLTALPQPGPFKEHEQYGELKDEVKTYVRMVGKKLSQSMLLMVQTANLTNVTMTHMTSPN